MLPYLEAEQVYREFHLDEPWDSPHNIQLLPRIPRFYAPLDSLPIKATSEPHTTFYQVFVGEGTAFEGREGLSMRDDFPNGVSNTILVVEAGEAVPWTKPVDLPYHADRPLPSLGGLFTGQGRFSLFGPNREKGFNVAFVDGSIRFLRDPVPEETLRKAITRNSGWKGDGL